MCHLLESICLQDGIFENLSYHQRRMDFSCRKIFNSRAPELSTALHSQNFPSRGLYKIRVIYTHKIEKIEAIPWSIPDILTLKAVYCSDIEYPHKYTDREIINRLFSQREDCDDILIVKNGLITDTSYCNILLRNKERWYTPFQPLLKGTMLTSLIEKGIVIPADIAVQDLHHFQTIKLINAMMRFNGPEIPVSNISL